LENDEIKRMARALAVQSRHNNEEVCQYCGIALEGLSDTSLEFHNEAL